MAAVGDECGVDIASQLAQNSPNIQVVLGGGRAAFTNGTAPGHVAGEDNSTSVSADSQDLIEDWLTRRTSEGKTARYVWNSEQFSNVSPDDTDYLLGLFSPNEMEYEAERNPDAEPSIAEMTEKAIDILSNNPKGYFLLVHAGGIENGYRDNDLDLAVSETVALDDAVGIAMEMVDQDTLIVVTSDRAASVTSEDLGTKAAAKSIKTAAAGQGSDSDSSNSTLANENGLQFGADNETALNTAADTEDNTATSEGSNPNTPDLESVGEDVPIYAKGPMSLLFHGVREQNFIAHALSFAACEASIQHHTPSPDMEPAGEKEERPASQQLEAGH
nr:hypothetical protein BaRGS_022520 [Batillaria attramentaria]